jgi:hypothetical protein
MKCKDIIGNILTYEKINENREKYIGGTRIPKHDMALKIYRKIDVG